MARNSSNNSWLLSVCNSGSPTRKSAVRRSNNNNHPAAKNTYIVLLTSITLMLLVSLLLSLSFVWKRVTQKWHQRIMSGSSLVIGKTFEELVGSQGSVTCSYARKHWIDPNRGQVFSRSTLVTQPSFAISVHKEAYDPVRWESIYMNGKYYEDEVHARFVQILWGNKDSSLRSATERRALRSSPQNAVKPVQVVMDVGSNIGYYSALSMALGYSVLAFEINPPNLLRMCETVELNKWQLPENDHNDDSHGPVLRLYQQGVSNENDQDVEVWVPKNPGQAFMRTTSTRKEEEKDDQSAALATQSRHHDHTKTITLDEYAMQHGWLIPQGDEVSGTFAVNPNIKVKILKIDVEGKEPFVVQGAEALLRSGIVENVLVEFRRLSREPVQEALLKLLDSRYTLVHEKEGKVSLTRAKELLVKLTEDNKGKRKTFDLWFQKIRQIP